MNNKDIVLEALRCHPVPRTPWVPFVGVHGGSLVGADATAVLQSADLIVEGLKKANELYRPDGLPVAFDLQLEAEALGCKLAWAKETPPSVVTHPFVDGYDFDALPEFGTDRGRMPVVLEATRKAKEALGDDVALYGTITGPLTLGLHLRGDDCLLDMYDEADEVVKLYEYCAEIGVMVAEAYLDAGVDVIAVVDPMLSQIGPEHLKQFVEGPLNVIFDAIRAKGGLSSLFVCGNATRNIEVMCATRCDSISVDENVDFGLLAKTAGAAGKSFGGNLQLTTVLLLGDENDARRDAVRCIDAAGDTPGFVLSPGCDLPYAVKPANMEAVSAVLHDPYQLDVARKLPVVESNDPFDDVAIPDYAAEESVIIDVVTLDSAGCAPCAYMLSAAQEAAKAANGITAEVREHKITGRDGLGYMKKLGVAAIPSICIDGAPKYASIIPEREAFVKEIAAAAGAK